MTTEKSTSFHTICRLLIREIRQQQNVQQAHISQLLGRASTSSWSKVESGETPLTLDHLLTACTACQVWLSALFLTAQNYSALLGQTGWFVANYGSPLPKDEDQLSIAAADYDKFLASKGQTPVWRRFPVLQTPWPYLNGYEPLDVFRWAIDPVWREQMLTAPQVPQITPQKGLLAALQNVV